MTSPARKSKRNFEQRYERLWKKHKVRTVPINPQMMADMLVFGTRNLVPEGLPQDAISCGWRYDAHSDMMLYLFAHESFKTVPMGEVIPKIEVVFKDPKKKTKDA